MGPPSPLGTPPGHGGVLGSQRLALGAIQLPPARLGRPFYAQRLFWATHSLTRARIDVAYEIKRRL